MIFHTIEVQSCYSLSSKIRGFLGGSVVKTALPLKGLVPGQGMKIAHTDQHGPKKKRTCFLHVYFASGDHAEFNSQF